MHSALQTSSSTRSGLVGPLRASLIFLQLLLGSVAAQAQTTNTWTGTTSTNWNTAGNWDQTRVPLTTDNVVIPSSPTRQPTIGTNTLAVGNSVEVQTGASLSIVSGASLTLNGSKTMAPFSTTFYNQGTVNNSGQLIIGNLVTANVGDFGIRNVGTFQNYSGGSITIDRSILIGLLNANGSFTNSASITIGAAAPAGEQGILNDATFANNIGGRIAIDRTSLIGLTNRRGSFTNSARITIGAVSGVGNTGILNSTTFQNTGCDALINIVANAVINNSSTFGNAGTIIENASGNSSISSNGGLVQNLNGGTFTIGSDTGVLTTTPGPRPTITATPSLTITQGQSVTLTASGATSYNWSNGESTSAISVTVAGPYSVTGTIGSCASVASVTLTVNAPVCGAGLSGPIWTGCVSRDWNTAGNWASGAVPTVTDDVVIPSGPANQPILSTTATAKSVEVQTGASLSISSAGRLTINGSKNIDGFTTAFSNRGMVQNAGLLILGNTADVGAFAIWNRSSFTNNGGEIRIDRTTNQGINNNIGLFTNTGTITIGASASVGEQGILNQAAFTNTGGSIQISMSREGITNTGTASFTNATGGLIQIDRSTSVGVSNAGAFVNSATITIGASTTVGGIGIQVTGGSFQNNTGGSIQIDRTGSHAIAVGTAGSFTNSSITKIGSITSVGGQGFSNAGTVSNNPGGTISINQTRTGVGGDGIYNLSTATFTNSATLTIGDVAFVAQDNIFNEGAFTNTTTGAINLDRAAGFGNGIWNNGGRFQNAGRLVLGANATTGSSGILNTAIFTNNTRGDITIDRPTGNALNNASGNALFTNAGRIRIGQNFAVGNFGLANSASAIFRNNAGGSIAIDQTNNDGLANITSATFVNSSTITVGTSATIAGDGIENSATFSNSACATLTVFDNINNSGDFTNAGLFTVNTAQAHTNTGTLTNNGVIEYPQGNPIPNVTNNDVIAAPISSGGNTFSPALQLGGNSNQFTVGTTWYTNPGLTTSAGTYNQGTNTFTAMNLAPGSSTTLYFAVTDNASGCTRTLSIVVTVQIRLTVLHRDVDNYADNNAVQPLLQLVNQGDITLPLSAITLRYYLTVEGAANLSNLSLFDAQVGTNNVRLRYVPLSPTQQGASGYVEVSFTGGAGNLAAGANSGSIKAYFAKSDYGALNELDDYSYNPVRDQLTATLRITAYYNGTLIAGIEPGSTAQLRSLRALTESKNGPSATQISTFLEVRNEGNVAINYSELKARYYFTSDGAEPLQVEVDEGMVQTQLVALSPAVNGANYYLEIRFNQAGQLAPGASTGTIRYRIGKPQGGRFDQTNDYSYQEQPQDRSQNSHVTVYVATERVWGTPPAGAGARLAASNELVGELSVRVLGNPVTGTEVVAEVSGAEGQPLRLQLVDLQGRLVSERLVDQAASVEQQRLAVGQRATGLFLLQVSTPSQRQTINVLVAN